MKKESKTTLQSFCEHMNAHFNRLVKNPNQSLGISCSSKKTETFIELVLEQNGYQVFSFDCNIYYKNKKPQLMSFFQTIKDRQNELEKPAILLKNGSAMSMNHEDNELFYRTLKNGFNLSDTSLFFPQDSTTPKESKNLTKLIRGCAHALPDNTQGVHFCPECGKPALVEDESAHTDRISDIAKNQELSEFISIFAVSRDYLPAHAHYTDILYPNGLSIESNPQVKKIWTEQEAAKNINNVNKTIQQKIDTLKERDNEISLQIKQAKEQVEKAAKRLDAMQEELLQKLNHMKPFSIPMHQQWDVTSHEMAHKSNLSDNVYGDSQEIKDILDKVENSDGYKKFSKFLKIGHSLTSHAEQLKKTDMKINKQLLQSFPAIGGFADSSPYDKAWGIHEIQEEDSFKSVFKAAEGVITKNLKNKKYQY